MSEESSVITTPAAEIRVITNAALQAALEHPDQPPPAGWAWQTNAAGRRELVLVGRQDDDA